MTDTGAAYLAGAIVIAAVLTYLAVQNYKEISVARASGSMDTPNDARIPVGFDLRAAT